MYQTPITAHGFNHQSFYRQPVSNLRQINDLLLKRENKSQAIQHVVPPGQFTVSNQQITSDYGNFERQNYKSINDSNKISFNNYVNGLSKLPPIPNTPHLSMRQSRPTNIPSNINQERFLIRQSSDGVISGNRNVSTQETMPLSTSRSAGAVHDFMQRERKAHTIAPLARISGPSTNISTNMFASTIAPSDAQTLKSSSATQVTSNQILNGYSQSNGEINGTVVNGHKDDDDNDADEEDEEEEDDYDAPIIVKVQYDPDAGGPPSEDLIRQAVDDRLKGQSGASNGNDPIVLNFLNQLTSSQTAPWSTGSQQPIFHRRVQSDPQVNLRPPHQQPISLQQQQQILQLQEKQRQQQLLQLQEKQRQQQLQLQEKQRQQQLLQLQEKQRQQQLQLQEKQRQQQLLQLQEKQRQQQLQLQEKQRQQQLLQLQEKQRQQEQQAQLQLQEKQRQQQMLQLQEKQRQQEQLQFQEKKRQYLLLQEKQRQQEQLQLREKQRQHLLLQEKQRQQEQLQLQEKQRQHLLLKEKQRQQEQLQLQEKQRQHLILQEKQRQQQLLQLQEEKRKQQWADLSQQQEFQLVPQQQQGYFEDIYKNQQAEERETQQLIQQQLQFEQQQKYQQLYQQQQQQRQRQQALQQRNQNGQQYETTQQYSSLPPMGPRPSRTVSSVRTIATKQPPNIVLANARIHPIQTSSSIQIPSTNPQQVSTITIQKLPNRNVNSAMAGNSVPTGLNAYGNHSYQHILNTFIPIQFTEVAEQPRVSVNNSKIGNIPQNLLSRPHTAPSSTEMFRPSSALDTPELSKENLRSMLGQIPDLHGCEFNIEYLEPDNPAGYPIPSPTNDSNPKYPEAVVVDQLPNNIIQHVRSSTNLELKTVLNLNGQLERSAQSPVSPQQTPSNLKRLPTKILRHSSLPKQRIEHSPSLSLKLLNERIDPTIFSSSTFSNSN